MAGDEPLLVSRFHLFSCKSAFGSHQGQYSFDGFGAFRRTRYGPGTHIVVKYDAQVVGIACGDYLLEGLNRFDPGYFGSPALLQGFCCNLLPAVPSFFKTFLFRFDHTPFRRKRNKRVSPQFREMPDDPIHLPGPDQGLSDGDMNGRFICRRESIQHCQMNAFGGDFCNPAVIVTPLSIKQDEFVTRF